MELTIEGRIHLRKDLSSLLFFLSTQQLRELKFKRIKKAFLFLRYDCIPICPKILLIPF